jgi:hypothetical protein
MGVNQRRPQMQQDVVDARAAAERRARCEAIVARWNAGPTHDWSLTPQLGIAPRRLSDHLMFEGQKQRSSHSPVDTVDQPCLIDPFSPDLAKPFMKAECGKTARSV